MFYRTGNVTKFINPSNHKSVIIQFALPDVYTYVGLLDRLYYHDAGRIVCCEINPSTGVSYNHKPIAELNRQDPIKIIVYVSSADVQSLVVLFLDEFQVYHNGIMFHECVAITPDFALIGFSRSMMYYINSGYYCTTDGTTKNNIKLPDYDYIVHPGVLYCEMVLGIYIIHQGMHQYVDVDFSGLPTSNLQVSYQLISEFGPVKLYSWNNKYMFISTYNIRTGYAPKYCSIFNSAITNIITNGYYYLITYQDERKQILASEEFIPIEHNAELVHPGFLLPRQGSTKSSRKIV